MFVFGTIFVSFATHLFFTSVSCGLNVKSCKLNAEQQNVLRSAKEDCVTSHLGRLSIRVYKIFFFWRQKLCLLWKSCLHSTTVCHYVPSCIIKHDFGKQFDAAITSNQSAISACTGLSVWISVQTSWLAKYYFYQLCCSADNLNIMHSKKTRAVLTFRWICLLTLSWNSRLARYVLYIKLIGTTVPNNLKKTFLFLSMATRIAPNF